jgi:hypothetical protein
MPFDNQAMQGLGMWPALMYQSQVADRKIPAIEQTWGPYLDVLSGADKVRGGPSAAGSNQIRGESMQPLQTGQLMSATPQSATPQSQTPLAGLQQAFKPRMIKGAQDIEADNYYKQKYPGVG